MVDRKPDIDEVAKWFLAKESMTHKKLQKLCYYTVAWGYALYGEKLFEDDEFQAWVHGPVSPKLYKEYKVNGWQEIAKVKTAPRFDDRIMRLLESVWATYGDKDGDELEALSHSERPWREARAGLGEEDRGENIIKPEVMQGYYISIYAGEA